MLSNLNILNASKCDSDTEHPLVTDRHRKRRGKVSAREKAKIKRLS